ncbi:glycosyltransferase family 2 protein [Sulfobacillus thermosulfidooxidans]|uniref:glycosyltransferase family 2 protein n=1 Tax=Sulfobacillus thermosulfidooxidans TaxID=28034 RepID=UPI00042052FA|nr:glycosyltransferase family 2 protein [Sulfobacillus thermosulfidooxidans]
MSRERVAAIVPAYNEEANIACVLQVLCQVPEIDQIIVVNDGSLDRTGEVAASFPKVTVIDQIENQGKGAALKVGAEAADADILLFLDADLIGLTVPHVQQLLKPVLDGETDATVGIFDGGRTSTDWAQALAPFLSGQRVLRRALLTGVDHIDEARFGVELQLHRQLKRMGKVPKEIILKDVSQVMKEEKLGLAKGFAARMRMYWEIIREIPRI